MNPNKDIIIESIVNLLESKIGYSINLFEMLTVYPLEDMTFAVSFYRDNHQTGRQEHVDEKIFSTALEAAVFFEEERRKRELGLDIEAKLNGWN